jgi:hypothetical protein
MSKPSEPSSCRWGYEEYPVPSSVVSDRFRSGDFDWQMSLHIFFCLFSKVFILKQLWASDLVGSGQNLEPQGLTAKIFRNKGLA